VNAVDQSLNSLFEIMNLYLILQQEPENRIDYDVCIRVVDPHNRLGGRDYRQIGCFP
jgi:hypothetical protein